MAAQKHLFTSESVTAGHPDKIADQISDAILDYVLENDPSGHVACNVFCTGANDVVIGGEITWKGGLDRLPVEQIARDTIRRIGYINRDLGFAYDTVHIQNHLKTQSQEIAAAVKSGEEQGAGDQGMMFGFAIDETREVMPLPIMLAHQLAQKLHLVRMMGDIPHLRPDGKTQVTVEYDADGSPLGIDTVVVSAQHSPHLSQESLHGYIMANVIRPVAGTWLRPETKYFINPSGSFVVGGPVGDTGLTGRKIIVDTYGGGSCRYRAGHGGGAFSGKDPSKVDRSAAYMARYIACNVVGAGLAKVCEVQLAYAIGVADPVSVMVNSFGTATGCSDDKLAEIVRSVFPLKPAALIEHLSLCHPSGWSYRDTATYGHFGRSQFPWERQDKIQILQKLAR